MQRITRSQDHAKTSSKDRFRSGMFAFTEVDNVCDHDHTQCRSLYVRQVWQPNCGCRVSNNQCIFWDFEAGFPSLSWIFHGIFHGIVGCGLRHKPSQSHFGSCTVVLTFWTCKVTFCKLNENSVYILFPPALDVVKIVKK